MIDVYAGLDSVHFGILDEKTVVAVFVLEDYVVRIVASALLATEIGALVPYASVLGGIEHEAVDVLVSAMDNVNSVDERYLGISYSLF